MIAWDFNVIVSLGMSLSLGIVIGLWLFYTLSRRPADAYKDQEFFRQCGFCSYLYYDYFKRAPSHCPRCGSYED